MRRDYWRPDELRHASRLLADAASNLHTAYPHSAAMPNSNTLPAVQAMIAAALECIRAAQPSNGIQPEAFDSDGTPLVRPGPGEALSN